jgi:hypothetical protein
MIELINDMIIYLKTGEKSKKLEVASLKNDKIIFNIIIINIMKWIKLEHKRITIMKVQSKPLKLYPDCKWCQALKELVRWVAHVN